MSRSRRRLSSPPFAWATKPSSASNAADQDVQRVDDFEGAVGKRHDNRAQFAALNRAGELCIHDMIRALNDEQRIEPSRRCRRVVARDQGHDEPRIEMAEQVRLAVYDQPVAQAVHIELRHPQNKRYLARGSPFASTHAFEDSSAARFSSSQRSPRACLTACSRPRAEASEIFTPNSFASATSAESSDTLVGRVAPVRSGRREIDGAVMRVNYAHSA